MAGSFNRVIEGVADIAKNLGCSISNHTGNRLADAIEVIAEKASNLKSVNEAFSLGDAAMPTLPENNGEYVLALTLEEGSTTLSWKAAE